MIVRFLVGQDEEKSIVRLNQKLNANLDLIPPGASGPLVKPRSIDDVPILALTLWSKRYGDFELRRIAAQVDDTIKQTPDVSAVTYNGGAAARGSNHAGRQPAWELTTLRHCRWWARWGVSNRSTAGRGIFANGNRRIRARNRPVSAQRGGCPECGGGGQQRQADFCSRRGRK